MRSVFYTLEQVEAARARCAPRLREFEAESRRQQPIPLLADLSAIDRCRYDLYADKMRAFTPNSPWRESWLGILHSDLVGLAAARDVFAAQLNCLVLLTSTEHKTWYDTGDHIVDGWYWHLWWRIHTTVLARFRDAVASDFPRPEAFDYWLLTHGRGSTSFHELWKYDGAQTTLIDASFAALVAEHGPIDEWFE